MPPLTYGEYSNNFISASLATEFESCFHIYISKLPQNLLSKKINMRSLCRD